MSTASARYMGQQYLVDQALGTSWTSSAASVPRFLSWWIGKFSHGRTSPFCSQMSSGVPSWAPRILSSCSIGLVSYMEKFCDSGSDPSQMPNTLQYYESSAANPRLVAGWRDQNGLDVWGPQFWRAAVRVSGKTWQPKIQKNTENTDMNATIFNQHTYKIRLQKTPFFFDCCGRIHHTNCVRDYIWSRCITKDF